MAHDYFWEHVNFEDPVKKNAERSEFRKCGNYCGCDEHVSEVRTLYQIRLLRCDKLWTFLPEAPLVIIADESELPLYVSLPTGRSSYQGVLPAEDVAPAA